MGGAEVIAIQPSVLTADASSVGILEERMKELLGEASQDGIILFIDEVHSIIGAGRREGTTDMASLLKPALARGDIACIAATTDNEYRRFIENDPALERRFQPVRVQELTAEQTLNVLLALRDRLAKQRNVQVTNEVLQWLVKFAQRFLRNRYFPDKAVDLLEQCVAYALTQDKKIVDISDAETVAQRMVGMPMDLTQRLTSLREKLTEFPLLTPEDTETLLNRLEVTVRGLDLRPARPDIVLLLIGEAATISARLAEIIAETLFGAAERIVAIDLSQFTDPSDKNMLIGAPPGYTGYSESLPIHQLLQTPWCVVRFENVHACHPQVRRLLAQAFSDGFITDSRGKKIYLSDTVVILTADIPIRSQRTAGFQRNDNQTDNTVRRAVKEVLGEDFAKQIDIICHVSAPSDKMQQWIENKLLAEISKRYLEQGMNINWDRSVVEWLLSHSNTLSDQHELEKWADENICLLLVRQLKDTKTKLPVSLLIKYEEGRFHFEISEKGEE
ncbi:MAG: ATP-dependent Clp protease ATP-binding subunit [Acidobacteria bacterium]|nr:MAG: ATP-dependent Clp protease ATP-binding subunit [Acidobacteriota bacterium]GIU80955.1 MAG: hypothetical protein KatS3mg006_0019 [Pyrinomonadaceae bacterium]